MKYRIEVVNEAHRDNGPMSKYAMDAKTIAGACFAVNSAIARQRGKYDGSEHCPPDELHRAMRCKGIHKIQEHGLDITILRVDENKC